MDEEECEKFGKGWHCGSIYGTAVYLSGLVIYITDFVFIYAYMGGIQNRL